MKTSRAFALTTILAAGAAVPFVFRSAPAVAQPAASESAGAFKVDPVHSMVYFRIGHMGVSYTYGRFNDPSGSYTISTADPSKNVIDITLETDKVDSGNTKRDDHLRNPDFFNAKQFPTITYKSKSFSKTGDKAFTVDGELTLLGVTKPVSAAITYVGEGETRQGYKSGFEAEFTIKRSEFGMTKYLEGNALGDEVTIFVTIEGAGAAPKN